jgi:hypothetical protein
MSPFNHLQKQSTATNQSTQKQALYTLVSNNTFLKATKFSINYAQRDLTTPDMSSFNQSPSSNSLPFPRNFYPSFKYHFREKREKEAL